MTKKLCKKVFKKTRYNSVSPKTAQRGDQFALFFGSGHQEYNMLTHLTS